MRKVWKYVVPVIDDDVPLVMPPGGTILHVGNPLKSVDEVTFWVEVNPTNRHHTRTFRVFGTGQDIPDGYVYVGTCKAAKGQLIWHLYEKML